MTVGHVLNLLNDCIDASASSYFYFSFFCIRFYSAVDVRNVKLPELQRAAVQPAWWVSQSVLFSLYTNVADNLTQ